MSLPIATQSDREDFADECEVEYTVTAKIKYPGRTYFEDVVNSIGEPVNISGGSYEDVSEEFGKLEVSVHEAIQDEFQARDDELTDSMIDDARGK